MFGWERLTNQKLMKAGVFATLSNPSISNLSKARKKKQRNRENKKYFVLFHHDTCYRTAACVSPKFDIKVDMVIFKTFYQTPVSSFQSTKYYIMTIWNISKNHPFWCGTMSPRLISDTMVEMRFLKLEKSQFQSLTSVGGQTTARSPPDNIVLNSSHVP